MSLNEEMNPPCPRCTRPGDAHSLRCPEVNLEPGWYFRTLEAR